MVMECGGLDIPIGICLARTHFRHFFFTIFNLFENYYYYFNLLCTMLSYIFFIVI
jgi:hypothetical protein